MSLMQRLIVSVIFLTINTINAADHDEESFKVKEVCPDWFLEYEFNGFELSLPERRNKTQPAHPSKLRNCYTIQDLRRDLRLANSKIIKDSSQ